jgi:hypothetical protein
LWSPIKETFANVTLFLQINRLTLRMLCSAGVKDDARFPSSNDLDNRR